MEDFDHHCDYLYVSWPSEHLSDDQLRRSFLVCRGTCVGKKNYRWFFVLISSCFVNLGAELVSVLLVLSRAGAQEVLVKVESVSAHASSASSARTCLLRPLPVA